MKLLTKEIEDRLPVLYSQENVKDPVVQVKFFFPMGRYTWYGTEYDPKDRRFFGYVKGNCKLDDELSYFSLDELSNIRVRGLKVERDKWFKPCRLSEIKEGLKS